jgi:hypothetical protein
VQARNVAPSARSPSEWIQGTPLITNPLFAEWPEGPAHSPALSESAGLQDSDQPACLAAAASAAHRGAAGRDTCVTDDAASASGAAAAAQFPDGPFRHGRAATNAGAGASKGAAARAAVGSKPTSSEKSSCSSVS